MSVEEIILSIEEILEDGSLPKSVKLKFAEILTILKSHGDISIKINKALSELEEIGDDVNLDSYLRTQIMNIASLLEKL